MKTPRRIYRIGVLGAGSISDYHIQGLQKAGAVVSALFGLEMEAACKKAVHYGIPLCTNRVEQLLESPDLDALVIATPDFTHAELAIAAARAGKPVLIQKPLARNSLECQAILDAFRQQGVPCYVSFMHRHFPEVDALRNLLQQGAFGSLVMIRQRNATPGAGWAEWFYRRELVGGGVAMQLGVHGIDLLRLLFGEIQAVKATTQITLKERVLADGRIIEPDNEDLALAWYRFASGKLATHEMCYNEVGGTDRFRMEVYGTQATAWLRTELGPLVVRRSGGAWEPVELAQRDPGVHQHAQFLKMLAGELPLDGSDLDGLNSVRVVEAIYRSAESGDWTEIDTIHPTGAAHAADPLA